MPAPITDAELRRQRVAFVSVVAVALLVGIAFAAHAPDRSAPSITAARAAPTTTAVATTDTTMPSITTATTLSVIGVATPTATATVDPGSLPQTETEPTASGAIWETGVHALWRAIADDDPDAGAPFFFPLAAYQQVKSINDPAGDYQQRLLTAFADDVHTLHAQLGADAASATFLGVDVPDGQAVWVEPGEEYNKLPYWRVYGTTLRYALKGETRTMPITSLISWRGEWYVVHLGAVR